MPGAGVEGVGGGRAVEQVVAALQVRRACRAEPVGGGRRLLDVVAGEVAQAVVEDFACLDEFVEGAYGLLDRG